MRSKLNNKVQEVIDSLKVTKYIQDLHDKLRVAKDALIIAECQFVRYSLIHEGKKTEEGDLKSKVNSDLADKMNLAIKIINAQI